jgi:hypothetical protein
MRINPKTEGHLKEALVKKLREVPSFVILRHEDSSTSGIPDISVTGRGATSWWEVKYGRPEFTSKGIQELTMLRLSRAGIANYIIYRETADGKTKQVSIARPANLHTKESWDTVLGFDHDWVVNEILLYHSK